MTGADEASDGLFNRGVPVPDAAREGVAGISLAAGTRIGFSTTTLEPSLNRGILDGIGVYTKALLDYLPATGAEVTPYSFRPGMRAINRAPLSIGHGMPGSFAALSARDFLAPRQIRTRLPVDLYHATDYRIVRMDCPVVATLHDAITLKHPEWCSPKARTLKNWVLRVAASKADHIISVSQFAVADLVQYFGIDERRISIVPCGVAEKWFNRPALSDVAETLSRYTLEPGYFLFVGTLQPRKNVDRILRAYLQLPAAVRRAHQCVLVGRPGWRCDATVARIRAAVANGERVVWLTTIGSERELRHIYSGAGVFVFPSLYEGFGIPLLEAFASGVPVVTANASSLPEVSDGAALEINALDERELASAMLSLVSDDSLRRHCIAAGQARAKSLTWRHTARLTADVYRHVLTV